MGDDTGDDVRYHRALLGEQNVDVFHGGPADFLLELRARREESESVAWGTDAPARSVGSSSNLITPEASEPRNLNPFVGPRPISRGEKLFGRDEEIHTLFNLMSSERAVWLYSPSGAGKTSLVQAGLVPKLIEDGFDVWPTIRVNLEPDPVQETVGSNRYVMSTLLSLEESRPPGERKGSRGSRIDAIGGLRAGPFSVRGERSRTRTGVRPVRGDSDRRSSRR